MKFSAWCIGIVICAFPFFCLSQSSIEGFVHINGGTFHQGDVVTQQNRPLVRVDDFEILDHPVTNKEYKIFIDSQSYPPPPHWIDGKIPKGKEDFPVIFIDRFDVDAFLKWLSQKDGRIYHLPTYGEFEWAARGGIKDAKYPWGNDDPRERANYNADGKRRFNEWQKYLKPAKWGNPNGYGLYGMAGNVWNMCVRDQEIGTYTGKFRIVNIVEQERYQCGGSWAYGEEFLRMGREFLSFCVKHPDIGFRPVREPEGEDWTIDHRQLCACTLAGGKVFLSWALLEKDSRDTKFNVYRLAGKDRYHAGFKINEKPISSSCTFIDDQPEPIDNRCQYYVRTVDSNGKEGRKSEWYGIDPTKPASNVVTTFKPLFRQGGLTPVFGDLNGDGTLDCVIRLDNGIQEGTPDPGYPVQLEAFTSYGKFLWRKDVCQHEYCYGNANNNPFNIYDMDGDGKAEVITRLQIDDDIYVAILDGMTGRVKYKAPWPPMASDTQRASTRIQLSVAYLDGVNPAVVIQTGVYQSEILAAFSAQLEKLWQFNSFMETSGSGGHKIEVADVDGDSKMEVFDGTTCLNHDGTLRWSIYKMHPDVVDIKDFIPERPGLEVFYIIESNVHAGVYMVDAGSGEIIWTYNRETDPRWIHAHYGWTGDVYKESPGLECISNRGGHHDYNLVLYSSHGEILLEPFPFYYRPLEWDGDPTQELFSDGRNIYNFNGKELVPIPNVTPNTLGGSVYMAADLYGDFRDELVVVHSRENGKVAVSVITNTECIAEKYIAKSENLDYRLWLARNGGGGYPTIFYQSLTSPK